MELANTQLVELSSIRPIQGWEEFFTDGQGYLKTAVGACEKKAKTFTAEILYNIIAMAIEKFVMAALMSHGAMPYNHTMKELVEAMDEKFPGSIDEMREGLLNLDKYQEICDLDAYNIIPPAMEEIPAMLSLASRLQQTVKHTIFGVTKNELTSARHS